MDGLLSVPALVLGNALSAYKVNRIDMLYDIPLITRTTSLKLITLSGTPIFLFIYANGALVELTPGSTKQLAASVVNNTTQWHVILNYELDRTLELRSYVWIDGVNSATNVVVHVVYLYQ